LRQFRSEAQKERGELEKQFGGLKLEVTHLNRFMERESMVNSSGPGIFTNSNKAPADPSSSAPSKGMDGCHIDNPSREHAYGSNVPNVCVSATSMNTTLFPPRGHEHSLEFPQTRLVGSFGDYEI
jgi:hypothetical protein